MKYLICENIVTHPNGAVINHSSIWRTFSNIQDARKYCVNNCRSGYSLNILKETSEGLFTMGWVAHSSYPKYGKTAFAWIFHARDGMRFINKDGSLGGRVPYQAAKIVDGKQVWYTKR